MTRKSSCLLDEDTGGDGTEESNAGANLEAGSSAGRLGGIGGSAGALEASVVSGGGSAVRAGRAGGRGQGGAAESLVARDRAAGARCGGTSTDRGHDDWDGRGAAVRLLAIAMGKYVWSNILGAGNWAGRDGGGTAACAAAGTLDGEGTEVVDLVTLLDLKSVVVAVGQGGGRSPDVLAAGRVRGQGLDGLEVTRGALAQSDGHGLWKSSVRAV